MSSSSRWGRRGSDHSIRHAAARCVEQLDSRILLSAGPSASATLHDVYSAGGTAYLFPVSFADDSAFDLSTFENGNVRVRGDNGFNQPAKLLNVAAAADDRNLTATYEITAPGGAWDAGDSGRYTVLFLSGQVHDILGNFVPGSTLGTFSASIAGIPFQPQLLAPYDTGPSSADGITALNNSSPSQSLRFSVSGTLPGALVRLYSDGTPIGSAIASGTTTLITTDGVTALPDGLRAITARQTGFDGKETGDSAAIPVTIQNTAPSAPAPPALHSSSDSGSSNIDGITNIKSPQLDVTAAPYFRVYRNGVLVSGPYASGPTYTSDSLADGTYQFTVAAVNAAGQESPPSRPLAVTIDTTAPRAAATLPDITQSGDTTYTFTVSYGDNLAVDTASLGNGNIVVSGPNGLSQAATFVSADSPANGSLRVATYRISAPGGNWVSSADGEYTVSVQPSQITDVAGNLMPAGPIGTFNVAADGLSAPDLLAESDTGFSSTDNITKLNNSTPPMALDFEVYNTQANGTLTLYADGRTAIGSVQASGPATMIRTDGSTRLSDGPHTITASETLDDGTQLSASPPLVITIRTVPPSAPPAPVLDPASDTGVSNSDGLTDTTAPVFDVTASGAGVLHLEGSAQDGGGIALQVAAAGTYKIAYAPAAGFSSPLSTSISVGQFPLAASGDFNGDGRSDLVMTGDGGTAVLLSNPNGSLRLSAQLPVTFPSAVVTGDFNHDGHTDIAIGDASSQLHIFLGNGDGTFRQTPVIPTTAIPSLAVADVNADGIPDIIVGAYGLFVVLGNAGGNFTKGPSFGGTNFISGLFAADLNHDGRADLVAENANGLNVLLGNGDGTFAPPASSLLDGVTAVADFNGDGNPDLLLGYTSDSANAFFAIAPGNGSGSFSYATTQIKLPGLYTYAAGDFNRDGNLDVAATYTDGRNWFLNLYQGDGAGGFKLTAHLPTVAFPTGIAVGDFNGDGRPDVALAQTTGNVFNQGGAAAVQLATGGFLPDGVHAVHAWFENDAGSRSVNSPDTTFTVDATPPAATLQAANVTAGGASSYQFSVTYADAHAITVSASGPSLVVSGPGGFSAAATLISSTANADSTSVTAVYQITPPGGSWHTADSGTYTIAIQAGHVSDAAGNTIPAGSLGTFTVAVAPVPGKPVLLAATDSGVSSTDGVTSFNNSSPATALQLTIPGVLAGATVTLYSDGTPIGSAVASSNSISITTDGATTLSDGTHSITAREQVPGGLLTDSSPALSITIESSPPAAPAAPVLANDTGYSNSDGITSATAPVLKIAAAPYFRVYLGGVLISQSFATGGTYTSSALPNGTYQFTVSAVNAAGNESPQSVPTIVTIDTVPPVAVATTPNVTAAGGTAYTAIVTYSDLIGVDVSSLNPHNVAISFGNQTSGFGAISASLDNNTNGSPRTVTYTFTPPGGVWDRADEGTYHLFIADNTVRDLAGNGIPFHYLSSFTVTADELLAPQLVASTDSGLSNSDGITNFNNSSPATAPQFIVPNTQSGDTVSVYSDGTLIGSAIATGNATQVSGDGKTTLADGPHMITAREAPPGGPQSPDSPPLKIVIDTTPPPAPPAPVLDQTSDSGKSNSDGITKVKLPTFDETSTEAGAIRLVGSDLDGGDASITVSAAGAERLPFPSQSGFLPPVAYGVAGGLTTVTGDLNGDGYADLVVLNQDKATVTILFGNGDGTFRPGLTVSPPTTDGSALYAAIGDVNGDGKPDLLLGPDGTPYHIGDTFEYLGNGDGTFQPPTTVATHNLDNFTSDIALVDLNHDGKLDIVGVSSQRMLFTMLGNGDGTFKDPQQYQYTSSSVGTTPEQFAIADFNGDGIPDIAVPTADQGGGVKVYFGNGDGTLQYSAFYSTRTNFVYNAWLAAADLNGDGKPDLIVSSSATTAQPMFVLLNKGGGTFGAASAVPGPEPASGPVIIDANRDGKPDIASVYVDPDNLQRSLLVNLGNGDGTFQQPISFPLPSLQNVTTRPGALTAGDFNHDGRTDLILSDHDVHRIYVLLGSGGPLPDGTHSLYAWAEDLAGNRSVDSSAAKITVDTAPPKPNVSAPNISTAGPNPYELSVTYTDATAVDVGTLDGNDIVVNGPNGFGEPASLVSVDSNSDGSPRTATYEVAAPAAGWLPSANGVYTVTVEPSEVADVAGNFIPTGPIGTFSVSIPATAASQALLSDTVSRPIASEVATDPQILSAGSSGLLLKDIDPRTLGSKLVQPISDVNGEAYFVTQDPSGTYTIWKSDGTAAGTVALKTIPTTGGGNPQPDLMGHLGNVEIFAATGGIWRTDATSDGTYLVSSTKVSGASLAAENFVYFVGPGLTLWRTDGTGADTKQVVSVTVNTSLVNVFGTIFFGGSDKSGESELWKTDATTGASSVVKDFGAGVPPSLFVNVGGTLFVAAPDHAGGYDLWASDGTSAGTQLVKDLDLGLNLSMPFGGIEINNSTLLFSTGDGTLWSSDGTGPGTQPITNGVRAVQLTPAGDGVYFVNTAPASRELWKTDGTTDGTQKVVAVPALDNLTSLGNQLLFSGNDPVAGNELWTSDGTAAGTRVLMDIDPGPTGSSPGNFAHVGNLLYFVADDGLHGSEPWKTDGTASGTGLVADLNPTPVSSFPTNFVAFNHNAFFIANGPEGNGLYRSDGTADGTVFVDARAFEVVPLNGALYFVSGGTLYRSEGNPQDAQAVAPIGASQYVATVNGIIYFTDRSRLWRTDGTAAGTFQLPLPTNPPPMLSHFAAADNYLAFYLFSSGFNGTVWRTDGTTAGTFQLAGNAGTWDGSNQVLRAAIGSSGHNVVFEGNTVLDAYRTDGTVAGTKQIVDSTGNPLEFPNSQADSVLVQSNGSIYLLAYDPRAGEFALYKTDGSDVPASKLADLSGSGQEFPYGLVDAGGLVFFWNTYQNTYDLWRSDGTASGTFLVKGGFPDGGGSTVPSALTVVGRSVYFTAQGPNGPIWQSDGTADGTGAVTSIPNPPASGVTVDGAFFYPNSDPVHGTELWMVPAPAPPAPPVPDRGLQATVVAPGTVGLTWVDPPGNNESSVRLERSTNPTFATINETVVLVPGTTSWQDLEATNATMYYYRIRTANPGGVSAASAAAAVQFGAVSGRAFEDDNYNGAIDPGELGLPGVVVYADLNGNGAPDPGEPSAITDFKGDYMIAGLLPGAITIRQVVSGGYRQTAPEGASGATAVAGITALGPVFGDVPISNVQLNFAYLIRLAQHYGSSGTIVDGDLNGDGRVNFADLVLLAQGYGRNLAASDSATTIITDSAPLAQGFGLKRRTAGRVTDRART